MGAGGIGGNLGGLLARGGNDVSLIVRGAPAQRPRRPRKGHVPAGRFPGHLQRAGHEAVDGAGAVQARHPQGLAACRTVAAYILGDVRQTECLVGNSLALTKQST